MFLLIFVLLLVIFFTYLPKIAPLISREIEQRVITIRDDELNLRSEVHDLKAEQNTISMTEEFAKHAKLQRRIDKYTAEIKRLASQRSQKMAMVNMAVKVSLKVVHTVTMIALIIWYRKDPLIQFPPEVFSPFFVRNFVSFPTGIPGGLGITCWIIVCTATVNRFHRLLS